MFHIQHNSLNRYAKNCCQISQHKARYCLHTVVYNRFVFALFFFYYLVIRATWLEVTGCDTKRYVYRRIIFRNTTMKST